MDTVLTKLCELLSETFQGKTALTFGPYSGSHFGLTCLNRQPENKSRSDFNPTPNANFNLDTTLNLDSTLDPHTNPDTNFDPDINLNHLPVSISKLELVSDLDSEPNVDPRANSGSINSDEGTPQVSIGQSDPGIDLHQLESLCPEELRQSLLLYPLNVIKSLYQQSTKLQRVFDHREFWEQRAFEYHQRKCNQPDPNSCRGTTPSCVNRGTVEHNRGCRSDSCLFSQSSNGNCKFTTACSLANLSAINFSSGQSTESSRIDQISNYDREVLQSRSLRNHLNSVYWEDLFSDFFNDTQLKPLVRYQQLCDFWSACESDNAKLDEIEIQSTSGKSGCFRKALHDFTLRGDLAFIEFCVFYGGLQSNRDTGFCSVDRSTRRNQCLAFGEISEHQSKPKTSNVEKCLLVASERGHVTIIRYLFEQKIVSWESNLCRCRRSIFVAALTAAISNKRRETAKYLKRQGVRLSVRFDVSNREIP